MVNFTALPSNFFRNSSGRFHTILSASESLLCSNLLQLQICGRLLTVRFHCIKIKSKQNNFLAIYFSWLFVRHRMIQRLRPLPLWDPRSVQCCQALLSIALCRLARYRYSSRRPCDLETVWLGFGCGDPRLQCSRRYNNWSRPSSPDLSREHNRLAHSTSTLPWFVDLATNKYRYKLYQCIVEAYALYILSTNINKTCTTKF